MNVSCYLLAKIVKKKGEQLLASAKTATFFMQSFTYTASQKQGKQIFLRKKTRKNTFLFYFFVSLQHQFKTTII